MARKNKFLNEYDKISKMLSQKRGIEFQNKFSNVIGFQGGFLCIWVSFGSGLNFFTSSSSLVAG